MGEVYRAEDIKLERIVALKVLPERFASEKDRLHRFIREAKTASALNHPNVAHIYEIGEENEIHFIAMELVEGTTLDSTNKDESLKPPQILEIAIQIADALQAAHARGVIHRDLKPGNIMMNKDKQVKVLDFGLAKTSIRESPEQATQLPTMTHTEPGLVLGTVPYMSPEQALGKPVDARSDLFSLGCILYELTAGRRPFSGKTSGELIEQITHSQPPALSRFSYDVSPEFERIVRKCLEKNPEERYQSVKDLLIDLRNLRRDTISGVSATDVRTVDRSRVIKATIGIAALAILAISGILFYLKFHSSSAIHSIAVLPFVNKSGDEKIEYLIDGITDSTINNLSQLGQIRVIARPTVFSYKGKTIDPQRIGQELKVDGIVTGSISQQQNSLIVQADLINVSEGTEIWGSQFSGTVSNIVSLQSEISKQISENLRLQLNGKEQQEVTKQYTRDSEAYRLYLQGLYFWNKSNEEGAKKSIQYFQQAIEKDPLYARAYAGVSDAYGLLGMLGYMSPQEAWPKSKAAALKALELDPEINEPHISLGINYMFYDLQWKDAEAELLKGAANPNNAWGHHVLYIYYGGIGNTREAVRQILLAKELDPLDVLTLCDAGFAYYLNRDYNNALIEESKALEMDPNYESALFIQAYIYIARKEYQKAIETAEKAVRVSNGAAVDLAALAYAHGRSGSTAKAQEILSELEKRSETSYVSPFYFGIISVALNQKDEAFRWIHKACEERTGDWGLMFLKTDPAMDPLRSDPRFADLLKCMKLQ